MPVIAVLVDHDELYQKMLDKGIEPIIVNDLPCTTEEDKEKIRELTINRLTSDTLSIVPTCGGTCRATTARNMLGRICPKCGNEVRSPMGDVSKSLLWIRAPQGVDKLVNLIAWKMLSTYFTKGGYDAICWLTDSAYNPGTSRIPIEIDKLAARGHTRDLNYFVANFDQIISDLMMIYPEKPNKPYSALYEWIDDHREKIFTKFQQLPSKSTFIADQTIVGQYMEETIQDQIDTIYHMVSIDRDFYDKSPRVIANRTARVLSRQADFYNDYVITNYQPKPGHHRRQIYGTRTPWAARGVISSVTGHHDSDEVEIPWRIAVPMFQHHIMGKLMRAGDLVNDAYGKILGHVAVYDPVIHKYLDETFGEFPGGRGPVTILHRNPTLQQGSMQRFYGKLKFDPSDPTIGMSILTVVAPNADFDGDALNLIFAVDGLMAKYWEVFAPEYNIFLLENPMETSGNMSLTKPIVMTGGAWMDDPDEQ